jgi:hypothetical protein
MLAAAALASDRPVESAAAKDPEAQDPPLYVPSTNPFSIEPVRMEVPITEAEASEAAAWACGSLVESGSGRLVSIRYAHEPADVDAVAWLFQAEGVARGHGISADVGSVEALSVAVGAFSGDLLYVWTECRPEWVAPQRQGRTFTDEFRAMRWKIAGSASAMTPWSRSAVEAISYGPPVDIRPGEVGLVVALPRRLTGGPLSHRWKDGSFEPTAGRVWFVLVEGSVTNRAKNGVYDTRFLAVIDDERGELMRGLFAP